MLSLQFRFAPKATELLHGREITQWAINRPRVGSLVRDVTPRQVLQSFRIRQILPFAAFDASTSGDDHVTNLSI